MLDLVQPPDEKRGRCGVSDDDQQQPAAGDQSKRPAVAHGDDKC